MVVPLTLEELLVHVKTVLLNADLGFDRTFAQLLLFLRADRSLGSDSSCLDVSGLLVLQPSNNPASHPAPSQISAGTNPCRQTGSQLV